MKILILVTLVVAISFLQPLVVSADGDILPEINTSTQDEKSATPASEEPAWGLTVIGLLLGGLLFMFLEIAIIPGFGAAGIIGLIGLIGGLALAYVKLSTGMAIAATVGAVFGTVLLILWFFYVFPNTRLGKQFVLEAESSVEDGCVAVQDLRKYVGKEGVTQTMLRPSGIAIVDGERLDVISDCEFVEKGTPIKIVKESGGRLVAAPIDPEA